MSTIKRRNFFSLDRESFIPYNTSKIKKLIDILNKDKLVIINGLKNIGKLNFIKEFISKASLKGNYFYFNKSDDIENTVSSDKELILLLNDYIQLYKKPKIIILQNTSKIDGIKDFITKIYKENYKIILIGNSIKIGGIKEIEIFANLEINKENFEYSLKYGSINEVKKIDSIELKKKFLILIRNDIFLNDIFKNYGLKSFDLYTFTLTYLANNNTFLSLREIQKKLNYIQKISLKTSIDYVDFSIQEKVLKRVYKYDIKNQKTITSKAKYYFTDNGIRNSLGDFELSKDILIENLVFNILEYNNFKVFGGFNGKFELSFYGTKDNEKIYIYISKEKTKEEVKKEVHKLLKLPEGGKKYLLVDSIEELGIKKLFYDEVEIVEVVNFLERFGK